jgi:hypothetical protein
VVAVLAVNGEGEVDRFGTGSNAMAEAEKDCCQQTSEEDVFHGYPCLS